MAGTKQAQKNSISLKGSTEMVSDFFHYGLNSILYQRAIYPAETFTRQQKFGLTLLVTTDPELKKYMDDVISQIKDWLLNKTIQKLVLVVKNIESSEVLERWQFDVECDKSMEESSEPRQKSTEAVNKEIQSVIRQITASVTFLPLIECACAFEILVYTDKDMLVPEAWGESGPALIANSQEVKLRSFSTTIHKVETMVAYKAQ